MTSMSEALIPVPAHRNNRPNPPRLRTPLGATDHHMAGYLPGTDRIFQAAGTGYATNLGIGSMDGQNYEVHEYVPDNQVAWGNGNDYLNTYSVSIEHENNRAQGAASKPTFETHELSARIHAMLAVKWGWRIDGIVQLVAADFPGHDYYQRTVPGFGTAFNVITHRSVALKNCPNELDFRWIVQRGNAIIREGVDPEPTTDGEEIKMEHMFVPGLNAGQGAVVDYAPGYAHKRDGLDTPEHHAWNTYNAIVEGKPPTDEPPRNAVLQVIDEHYQPILNVAAGMPLDWDLEANPTWTLGATPRS